MVFGRGKNQADRDAAIALVRNAAADGRITGLDRDHRIEQISQADTVDDIAVHVRDLALPDGPAGPVPPAPPPTYGTPSPTAPAGQQPPVSWRPAPAQVRPRAGSKGARIALGVVLVLVIGGTVSIAAILFVFSAVDSQGPTTVHEQPNVVEQPTATGPAKTLSKRGYDRLIDALRQETGRTDVFRAVIRDDYAVLDVPVDDTSQRFRSYYWNGALRASSVGSEVHKGRVDLRDANSAIFKRQLAKLGRSLTDVNDTYVILQGKDDREPAHLMFYVVTEFNETEFVRTDLKGRRLG